MTDRRWTEKAQRDCDQPKQRPDNSAEGLLQDGSDEIHEDQKQSTINVTTVIGSLQVPEVRYLSTYSSELDLDVFQITPVSIDNLPRHGQSLLYLLCIQAIPSCPEMYRR
jgi:hypothetical protein